MHLYHLTQYSLLSETVHSNVRDLERHYLENADGDLGDIRWEPGVDDLHEVVGGACVWVLDAVGAAVELFEQTALQDKIASLRHDCDHLSRG
jgi:hypothetical protein